MLGRQRQTCCRVSSVGLWGRVRRGRWPGGGRAAVGVRVEGDRPARGRSGAFDKSRYGLGPEPPS